MLGLETAPNVGGPASFLNSDLFDADDDSDEEVVRTTKTKQSRPTKAMRLIMSDDDDEDEENDAARQPSLSDDGKSENGEQTIEETKQKQVSKSKNAIQDSSDSDESDNDDNSKETKKRKVEDGVKSSDDSDGSDSSDDEGSGSEDGEEDEDEEIAFQLTPPEPVAEPETNGDERSTRRRRIKKDELQHIHSETQRIVRESTVRLPYHRPKPLTLDELFSKKPSITTLKPIGGRVPRIRGTQVNNSEKLDKSREDIPKEVIDELPDIFSSQTNKGNENNIEHPAETDTVSKDLGVTETKNDVTDKVENVQESPSLEKEEVQMDTDDGVTRQRESSNSPVAKDPQEGLESSPSLSAEEAAPSSSTSPPKEKEQSSPQASSSQQHSPPKEDNSVPKSSQHSPRGGEYNGTQAFKTPSPTTANAAAAAGGFSGTQSDLQSSQARRMKLLQDSLSRLKGMQPKLSGSPKLTIDLDEGEELSPQQKGMEKLMQRYVSHTRHIKTATPKEVKVNIVTKEKDDDGKEELKQQTLSVGLDGKPVDIDPTLNIPGAKLVRLKENLQATMKVKREQERQKRQAAFKLDNEEGFGGGDDEDEAELTDGSETEEEEGVEDLLGNEDDDADYEPENEFVDDEADSDDDDNDDEEEEAEDAGEDEMDDDDDEGGPEVIKKSKKKSRPSKEEKTSGLESDDEEISPSRRKGSKRRAMVVADDADEGEEEEDKMMSLRLDSTETDDTDTEINDALQDSARFSSVGLVRTPRSASALDQSTKTMDMFDSTTNSTVTSDFQVPISRADSSTKKVTWSAGKDTDSSKDSTGFVFPAPVRQDSSSNSLDTSFEMMTSLIPAHQPEGGMRKSGRASVDSSKGESFTPFSKHRSVLSNMSSKNLSRMELTLPVEDSQDLFREDSPRLPLDSQQVAESQSFHFSFEDETQTQYLDENGLLNLKSSSSKKESKKQTLFEDTQIHKAESQSSMEELLGLCSGQFTETQGKDESAASQPGSFSQVSQRAGTQANMDELLNLCSGTFTEINAKSQMTSTMKMLDADGKEKDDDDDDAASTASFHIMSDPDGMDSDSDDDKRKDRGFSSDEEDDQVPRRKGRQLVHESDDDDDEKGDKEGENSDLDSEFEFEVKRKSFKGKTYVKPMKLANFVEDEAELSGSEADSDENYDAEDEPDEEDLEGIVNEEMGNEDELRNQVNRVHMKTMDDDDARRLRLMKEMYLPDGDLHSDNKGRTRNFRWRHLDSQMDIFRPDSDGEEGDEEDAKQDEDTQWRLQRHQREQWLKENKEMEKPSKAAPDSEVIPVEEDSQFAKCIRAAFVKRPRAEAPTQEIEEKEKEKEKKVGTPKPLRILNKRGSFLNRSKNDLAKMASMLKPIANPKGPRSSRNFIFQSAEASLGDDSLMASNEAPQVKRSASVTGPSSTPSPGPQAKRPRLERSQSQFTSNSVFRHF